MKLEDIGYNETFEKTITAEKLNDFEIGRIIAEHKERYTIKNNIGEFEAEITDLTSEQQLAELKNNLSNRINNIPVITISNETQDGYEALKSIIEPGKTYCMLGSSGVGKSTLMNNLSGSSLMKTDAISTHTSKGRHTTSHRELIVLERGGILIDNPGMREVGIADSESGLETAFDQIIRLSKQCRYIDCTHTNEPGCSVLEAVEKGEIDHNSYINYRKMERERAHFESTLVEKRTKDKVFGKMMMNYKKDMKSR